MSSSASDERRRARASAHVRVFRPGDEEAEATERALYWLRIPIEERAEFVWKLSLEIFALSNSNP